MFLEYLHTMGLFKSGDFEIPHNATGAEVSAIVEGLMPNIRSFSIDDWPSEADKDDEFLGSLASLCLLVPGMGSNAKYQVFPKSWVTGEDIGRLYGSRLSSGKKAGGIRLAFGKPTLGSLFCVLTLLFPSNTARSS